MNRRDLVAAAKVRQARRAIRQLDNAKEAALDLRWGLNKMSQRAYLAEASLRTAREDGATAVLRAEHLPKMLENLANEMARVYGPEAMKHVEKLRAAERRPRKRLDLRASVHSMDREETVMTIEGVIPECHYAFRVRN